MSRISLAACLAGMAVALLPRMAAPQSCDDQSYHYVHVDKHAPEILACGPYPPGYGCNWVTPVIRCSTGRTQYTTATGACRTDGQHFPPPNPVSKSCSMESVMGCSDATCDGIDNNGDGQVDEGCKDQCLSQDGAPVTFNSGLVKTLPRTDFRLPTSDPQVPLELVRLWLEGDPISPGYLAEPTHLENYFEHPTSFGYGWRGTFMDQLYLPTTDMSSTVRPAWISRKALVSLRFTPASYVAASPAFWRYTSENGEYELHYYGVSASGPHARIVSMKDGRVWEFSLHSDVYVLPNANAVFLLDRVARPPDRTSFSDGTGYAIARDEDGKIQTVTDTEGRQLVFEYGTASLVKQVTLNGEILARFQYFPIGSPGPTGKNAEYFLERVELGFTGSLPSSYIRYLYQDVVTGTPTQRLLTKVVVPNASGLAPIIGEPTVLPGEVALEAHQFNGAAQAKRSTTPAEDFGYEYNSFLALTSQYDLLHPQIASGSKVSCTTSSNCAVGYGCWRNVAAVGGDNFCYRVDTIQWNTTTFATSIINGSSAKAGSGCVLHPAAQMFKTKVTTAPSGMKTSYSWDTKGRPLCIVEGDNDDVAGTPPSCSGPATARVTSFSYTGDLSTCDLTITETRKSIVSGASPNQTSTTTAYDCVGNVTSRSVTGWTRSLAGTAVQETRAATSTFDNLGRLTRTDGPMPNTTAFDVVDYAYHGATGDANAYRLQSVTRYAGTSSTCPGGAGCVALTTTYENYDKFGTPRTVMDPSGIQTVRVTDALGRVTEERVYSSLGDEVRSLTYNPYGSVRSQIDGDGVCSTFDYNTNGTLRARRRSAVGSLCGATPISLSVGEVEAYVYDVAYPTQVAEVDRYQDGTLRYQKKLTYDGKGYLGSRASSIDPTKARTYTYDPIGLMTADQDANCYPGSTTCTKSTFGVDPLGRRTSEARAVTDTQNAVTGFQYASSDAILPSSVTTGDGTTVATTTTYVYNDFAELVEFVSPDSGTTRLAYDPGGHAITRREGVGTADQRTVQTTFDSLGRPTLVDHDTEHPVDCASAPTGTPITDEEYVYDTCPGTVPTGFTCGSQAAGRLTLARVKLHCSGGTEFGRGTWYQYGPSGRVAAVAVADDSQMATPFVTTYEWTPGGRTRTITNPLSASYGMKFAYGPDGEVLEVRQTDATETPYVTGVSHAPFGPVTGYTTQSMSGGQPMVIEVGYYPDYSVQTKEAKRGGTVLGGFTYTRDETGRVTARNSLFTGADAPIDRWYLYDRVGRLLCETTSPQSTCPTSGPDLRATFTYNNGQAGLAPDNRASAAFATDGVTFPLGAAGAYTYAPSSNRLTSVGTLNYYYDALGRRTKDDDTYFSGIYDEARTYTYLPNGRLGTIQGKVPADGATGVQYDDYTVAIAYDHRGRMFHWSYTRTGIYAGTDSYDVFYDERDRLIAVNWNPNTNRSASEVPRTWHVAYLHGERISTTQVQDLATLRGWYLNDELGVSYQEFDAVGTAVSRDIEGFGSASPASQGILDFRLPGQLALPGTEVVSFDPGSSCNGADCPVVATRALVLHNWNRDYDSDIGRYMEDDPARSPLTQAREYTYSGNAPLLETDPTGLAPKIDCVDPIRRQLLETAIYLALATIAHCKSGCAFGSNFLEPEWFSYRTRWMENILESHYQCKDLNMNCGEFIPRVESGEDRLLNIGTRGFFHPARCGCLEGLVAHEALHEAPFGYAHWKFLPPIEWKNIHAVDPGYVIPEKCFPCAVGAN